MKRHFSTKDFFGNKLEELWESYEFDGFYGEIKNRGFAIQEHICFNGILFIGFNPSYNDKTGSYGNIYYNPTFTKTYPYFKEFVNISEKTGLPWSHIDLLFVRETTQKHIQVVNDYKFSKFLQEQYTISKEIIFKSKPAVIVVCNALASEWIRNDKDIRTTFDDSLGTYRITGGQLDGTPLFYSGMLTGQRALDKGSRERLIWHIKKAIERPGQI